MDFKTFIDEHWDVFLSHICEFHPLDNELISTFHQELNWFSISKNQSINWDIEFLEKYENSFLWHELAWNSGIEWTTELIKPFKKRLDWYYLGRNTKLPITKSFIEEYKKNIFIIESNIYLTAELKKQYGKRLLPAIKPRPNNIKKEDLKDIDAILAFKNQKLSPNSREFYEEYILKEIEDSGLWQIFKDKFDYTQRFYYFSSIQNDIYGLTPEFVINGDNPFQELQNDRNIINIPKDLELINGSLQEGKARLFEVPRFRSFSFSPVLLVSENVKTILEQFKLPEHSFTSVKINPKRLNTHNQFYLLQLNNDTLTKDIDYSTVQFRYRLKKGLINSNSIYSEWKNVEDRIHNYQELNEVAKKLRKKAKLELDSSIEIEPSSCELTSDYDLYSYTIHGKFIVTDQLKQVLDKLLPKQMRFRSAQLLNISMDSGQYSLKDQVDMKYHELIKPIKYTNVSEDQFFFEKKNRLEYSEIVIDKKEYKDDEFKEVEQKLSILFPDKFKRIYRKQTIPTGYNALVISEFYNENEYSNRQPETYKAIIFAENGCGDSLGLILDKKSDYKLKPQIFEFLHETGEVEKV